MSVPALGRPGTLRAVLFPSPPAGTSTEDPNERRKRHKSDSFSLTFDDSLSWCVIGGLRRERGSSESSDSRSNAVSLYPCTLHTRTLYPTCSHPVPLHPTPSHPTRSHPAHSHPAPLHPTHSHPAPLHPTHSHPAPLQPTHSHPAPYTPVIAIISNTALFPHTLHPSAVSSCKTSPCLQRRNRGVSPSPPQEVGVSAGDDSDESLSQASDCDNFSVEFEVESMDSDAYSEQDEASVASREEEVSHPPPGRGEGQRARQASAPKVSLRLSPPQVYEVIFQAEDEDSFEEDTEITEAVRGSAFSPVSVLESGVSIASGARHVALFP